MDVIDEGAYGIVWKAVNRETSQLGILSYSKLQLNSSKNLMKINFQERLFKEKSKC